MRVMAIDYDPTMVTLRPYRSSDRDLFVALVSNPDVMRNVGGVLSVEQADLRLTSFCGQPTLPLRQARTATRDSEYVGHGFLIDTEDLGGTELGFLVSPAHQRCGVGTQIAKAVLAIAFDDLGLKQVFATVDDGHHASIRVLHKAGFVDAGIRHDDEGPYRLFEARRQLPD